MTNDMQLCQVVLNSWEECNKKGISKDLDNPAIRLEKKELIEIMEKKKRLNT